MTWEDINLKDYEELQNLYKTDKQRFSNNAIEYLFKIKNADTTLSLVEYAHYLNELKFFQSQPPKAKLKTSYTLNGKEYNLCLNMAAFSAVQFQDFTTYQRQTNPSTIDLLSVVLIPRGHRYNEDYDIEEAKEDIGTISVSDANAIVFFFVKWLRRYVGILNDYLTRPKTLKKIPTEIQAKMKELTTTLQKILQTITE